MCNHIFIYPEDKPENVNRDGTLTGTCRLCGLKDKSFGKKYAIRKVDKFYHKVPYGEINEKISLSDN